MRARAIARKCIDECGAARMSDKAEDVAMIAIATAEPDLRAWRKKIRSAVRSSNQEYGSIFLIIVLPIIVNLISAWLAKWIFNEHPRSLEALRMDARSDMKSEPA